MKKAIFVAVLAGALTLGFGGTAKADPITFTVNGNTVFTVNVTSTDVTINVSCLDATCQAYWLTTVGVKGLSFDGDPTEIQKPNGFADVANGGTNLGQTGACDGTQLQKSVCWTISGSTPLTQIGNGLTFEAGLTNGSVNLDDVHLQAIAFSDQSATTGTRVFAVSQGPDTTTQTPEPASLTLLGLSLLGVPFLRRKK
jgi:hypothetical protein